MGELDGTAGCLDGVTVRVTERAGVRERVRDRDAACTCGNNNAHSSAMMSREAARRDIIGAVSRSKAVFVAPKSQLVKPTTKLQGNRSPILFGIIVRTRSEFRHGQPVYQNAHGRHVSHHCRAVTICKNLCISVL